MQSVREPAVAGTFYPNDPAALSALIDTFLVGEDQVADGARVNYPKAIIAPHAGYVYSGSIAGKVYSQLAGARGSIKRVLLLGPSHRVAFRGLAVPSATCFRTPLGDIPIAGDAIAQIVSMPNVDFLDQAHAEEHSLEVHLPFLQKVLGSFELVPIVVGDASKEDVCRVLEALWGGSETLVVISSDLSHFESYATAQSIDKNTARKITSLDATLTGNEACGCRPVNGLLQYLKTHHMNIETVDVKNSGDTAGTKDRVVGYGAWRVLDNNQSAIDDWTLAERQMLLQLAREAIRSPLEGQKNFDIDLHQFPSRLKVDRATFVTLNLSGRLRGCIGTLEAHRPLVLDVGHNAQAAAFKDPRFSPLTHQEYQNIELHISVLGEPKQLEVSSRDELIEKLRPGIDGLIIKESGRQATYLPSVWEQLPDPVQFVAELRRKAGLSASEWQAGTQVFLYTTEEFS